MFSPRAFGLFIAAVILPPAAVSFYPTPKAYRAIL